MATKLDAVMKKSIGTKIFNARGNLTREKLAEKADVEANSIYRYETGRQVPSYLTMIRIADALNVSVEDFAPDGMLDKKKDTKDIKGAAEIFYQLTEEQQDVVLRLMKTMIA